MGQIRSDYRLRGAWSQMDWCSQADRNSDVKLYETPLPVERRESRPIRNMYPWKLVARFLLSAIHKRATSYKIMKIIYCLYRNFERNLTENMASPKHTDSKTIMSNRVQLQLQIQLEF